MTEEQKMMRLINQSIKQYFKKNNIRTLITGTVTAADVASGTYSVQIDGDTLSSTDIPSVNGLTISINDRVLMGKVNGDTTNLTIMNIL